MKNVIPSCFLSFKCIANRCPDTCCAGWSVDLDDDIIKIYERIPGEIGDALRKHMIEEDGYICFRMHNGQCPFLTENHLCQLILTLGEDVLSETCREHPRFFEDYGDLRETCLGISCPEAARLLFTEPFSLREILVEPHTAEPLSDFDLRVLNTLMTYRSKLFSLACCDLPLAQRLMAIASTGEPAQLVLEEMEFSEEAAVLMPGEIPGEYSIHLRAYLSEMTEMEFTRAQLKIQLEKALSQDDNKLLAPLYNPRYTAYGATLLSYFLYRYIPRAVWNLEIMDKVRFCAYSVGAILALAPDMPGATPLDQLTNASVIYCRETEHSDENLDMLYRWLWEQG